MAATLNAHGFILLIFLLLLIIFVLVILLLLLLDPGRSPPAPSGRTAQRQNPQATPLLECAGRPERPTESAQSSNLPCLTCNLVPRTAKNGALMLIWRLRRRARQPGSLDVKSHRRVFCNRAQPPGSSAKWRFWPLKKRHKCAIFRHFFVDFPRVFSTSLLGLTLWRESDLENYGQEPGTCSQGGSPLKSILTLTVAPARTPPPTWALRPGS